ncbi:MAG: 3-hydroxyacyl-CoA dehydrogenase family protein [Chryseosolibacter sp.]
MKILVIGERIHLEEYRQKFGHHSLTHLEKRDDVEKNLDSHDVIFDFTADPAAEFISSCAGTPITVFVNTCYTSLAALLQTIDKPLHCRVFGFNGMPTLFNREFLEVSVAKAEDVMMLKSICRQLNTEYLLVDDRVGLVTPRVICMIINEAYYTVQEGTASREDIDLAMKLGTNYPYGPFEWCEKIGLGNVYELLQALYEDTKDERYKIPALMKKEYLASEHRGR